MTWLAIAVGGAAGALARYAMMSVVASWMVTLAPASQSFPWGTLMVNLSGSVLIGILYVLFAERMLLSADLRALLVVGFLGAFTTFSTFSLDTILLIEQGWWLQALLYTLGSVTFCVLGAWLGMALMRLLA